jgi:hypothetical protein
MANDSERFSKMNGRQAAQARISYQHSMPIDADCAMFPDLGEAKELNQACDRWLRKRGLIHEHFNNFRGKQTTNTTDETI